MMNDEWWMMNDDEPSQEGSGIFFLAAGDPDSALASAWRKAVVQGLGVSNSELWSHLRKMKWTSALPKHAGNDIVVVEKTYGKPV